MCLAKFWDLRTQSVQEDMGISTSSQQHKKHSWSNSWQWNADAEVMSLGTKSSTWGHHVVSELELIRGYSVSREKHIYPLPLVGCIWVWNGWVFPPFHTPTLSVDVNNMQDERYRFRCFYTVPKYLSVLTNSYLLLPCFLQCLPCRASPLLSLVQAITLSPQYSTICLSRVWVYCWLLQFIWR